ncbi:hypothetical protein [Oceanobacillus chungangensis]|uniref:Uncharacterized protein n=1 Tax=Oceanobacillus chungangensis TaxID=1229152 RepID=A0A3D8PUF3_9BACI|nr:hypothetical protein [Oceanobacillus chungangensis]RDW18789.1 hypothetical protein CWR45_09345 [Oceanobacillus chungangensis]
MDLIEWNTVFTDVLTGVILLGIGAVFGFITGKKKTALTIERKNELYQPLLEELESISYLKNDGLTTKLEAPFLAETIVNDYKYGYRRKLNKKCTSLYSLINQYNSINIVSVAHNIIVDIFENSYEELYGSKIEGISYHSDIDGNEWEEEHLAEPIEFIRRFLSDKSIVSLLNSEGMYDSEVCIDKKNNIFVPIYGQLVSVFYSVLNMEINGVRYQLPPIKKELEMSPAEYMALNDFFKEFNANTETLKKYKLKEEIISNSQDIVQDLKEVIRKIVRNT